MATITITVPNSGPVVTRVAAVAQARHNAKFVPPATPTVVTDLAAVKEMLLDYLIGLYNNDVATTSSATAKATVDAAIAQAQIDGAAAIT